MVLILYRNLKSNLHNAPKCLQVSQIQNVNKSLLGKRVYTNDFSTKMSSFIKEFERTQFHTREVFVSSVLPVYNLSMFKHILIIIEWKCQLIRLGLLQINCPFTCQLTWCTIYIKCPVLQNSAPFHIDISIPYYTFFTYIIPGFFF